MRLLIILLIIVIGCVKHAEPEDYYLPQDFIGPTVVLYGIGDGQQKKYVNGRRQYHVPESGVLYTQFSRVKGILNQRFFFENDTTIEITQGMYKDTWDRSSFYTDWNQDGRFSLIDPSLDRTNINSDTIPLKDFIYFIIIKGASNRDSLRRSANELLDRVIESYQEEYWRDNNRE